MKFIQFDVTRAERPYELMRQMAQLISQIGSPLDMVHHGENGFLFELGDVRNLIGGVRRIVDDADLYAQMQAGALKEAQSRSWKAVMDGLLDVYHQYASASECLKFRCVKDKSREPVLKH